MRRVVRDEFEWPIRVDVEERAYLERPPGGKLKMIVVESTRESAREPAAGVERYRVSLGQVGRRFGHAKKISRSFNAN